MTPQRIVLSFYLGKAGPCVTWGGRDRWTNDPAVECACGWSVNVSTWSEVRPTAKRHLMRLVPTGAAA